MDPLRPCGPCVWRAPPKYCNLASRRNVRSLKPDAEPKQVHDCVAASVWWSLHRVNVEPYWAFRVRCLSQGHLDTRTSEDNINNITLWPPAWQHDTPTALYHYHLNLATKAINPTASPCILGAITELVSLSPSLLSTMDSVCWCGTKVNVAHDLIGLYIWFSYKRLSFVKLQTVKFSTFNGVRPCMRLFKRAWVYNVHGCDKGWRTVYWQVSHQRNKIVMKWSYMVINCLWHRNDLNHIISSKRIT